MASVTHHNWLELWQTAKMDPTLDQLWPSLSEPHGAHPVQSNAIFAREIRNSCSTVENSLSWIYACYWDKVLSSKEYHNLNTAGTPLGSGPEMDSIGKTCIVSSVGENGAISWKVQCCAWTPMRMSTLLPTWWKPNFPKGFQASGVGSANQMFLKKKLQGCSISHIIRTLLWSSSPTYLALPVSKSSYSQYHVYL